MLLSSKKERTAGTPNITEDHQNVKGRQPDSNGYILDDPENEMSVNCPPQNKVCATAEGSAVSVTHNVSLQCESVHVAYS